MMARVVYSFLLLALVHAVGNAQVVGERVLPDVFYRADRVIEISIVLTEHSSAVMVIEEVPVGWTVEWTDPGTDVSSEGVITWNTDAQTLKYRVRTPSLLGDRVSFTGTVDGAPTAGMTDMVPIQPQGGDTHPYDVYFPDGYSFSDEDWPVLFTLHGRSDGSNPFPQLPLAGSDFLQISPRVDFLTDTSPNWTSEANHGGALVIISRLLNTIEEVLGNYRADRSRVYCSGQSGGGAATMAMSNLRPELFAAVAPMAQNGNTDFITTDPDRVVNIPMWFFYGEIDAPQPPWRIETSVNAHRRRGAEVKSTLYPGADHGAVSGLAYATPELYEWFLQHRKPSLIAVRDVSEWRIAQGESFDVALHIHVRDGETSEFRLEERFPSLWDVSDIRASHGTFTVDIDNTIGWSGTNLSESATLNYTLNAAEPPVDRSALICDFSNGSNFDDTLRSDLLFVPNDLRPFTDQLSIGAGERTGLAGRYGGEWGVVGAGPGVRRTIDGFHYLYRHVNGDFRLRLEGARVEFNWKDPTTSVNGWAKFGIMARQNLETGAAHAFAMIRLEDQPLLLQSRQTEGAITTRDTVQNVNLASLDQHNGSMGLKRNGDVFTCFYVNPSGEDVEVDSVTIGMADPVFVGIAATGSEPGPLFDSTIFGQFSNVEFIHEGQPTAISSWMIYQ